MNQYVWEKSNPDSLIEEVTEDILFLIDSACSVSMSKTTLYLTAFGCAFSNFRNFSLTFPPREELGFSENTLCYKTLLHYF